MNSLSKPVELKQELQLLNNELNGDRLSSIGIYEQIFSDDWYSD